MPFRVIRGTYHVKGYSPDGDSIRFKADNENNWALLAGPPAGLNAKRHAQLRLEAIDTLETHFQNHHQPLDLAKKAMDHLLVQLGVTGVVWNEQGTMVVAANDGTAGYILSREVERNRRPVAFAFEGVPPEPDGKSIHLDAARLGQSVNAEILRSGLAYPTYYKGLFADLREESTALVSSARNSLRGVWREDKTNTGFEVTGMESITADNVILPKLFRRLAAYLEGGGPAQGFKEYLEQLAEEVLIISAANSTHLDNLVKVTGNVVTMTELPENLMFAG